MYYQKFINFLKEHNLYNEEIINYWQKNKLVFDYLDDEKRQLIGCFYIIEKGKLKNIKIIVPFIDDDKTILINIHEYIHLLLLYPKIYKKCNIGIDSEILPLFYERIYIEENKTEELLNYYNYINNFIIQQQQKEYIIALNLSKQLLEIYNNDNIYKLEKKAKKLVKKYKTSNI